MEKSPQELYKEREKRFMDAVQLKVPRSVPVVPCLISFRLYMRSTSRNLLYDMGQTWMAGKTALDSDADMYWNSYISYREKALKHWVTDSAVAGNGFRRTDVPICRRRIHEGGRI